MPVPPVTHYKDEAPETQEILNQELDKEVQSKVEQETQPKLNVLPVNKSEKKKTNASNIVNAFRQKMSLNTTPIELPSIGRTVEFKEIPASEQKELSRIAMESDSRTDIMYCAMSALINRLAMEKDFDIRDYTEFERISITLHLQQMNKLNPEIKYTCSKCGRENSYRLDTPKLLRNFSKTYKPDKDFEVEANGRKFTFTVGWPNVRIVENFFKSYYKKYDNSSKAVKDSINNLSQIEYITMFLKKVKVEEIADPEDSMTADLEELTFGEREQIIDCLPQSILFDDDTGIISKTIAEFVEPMNAVFKYNDCAFCGAEQTGAMASMTDFMGA
jgi:hypothetical protein